MANRDAINQVIASIRGEVARTKRIGFNMDNFFSDTGGSLDNSGRGCGTVACIAGHAFVLQGGKVDDTIYRATLVKGAAEFLGVTDDAAEDLFYGYVKARGQLDLSEVTPLQAISVLETLRDTGIVDWVPVMKEQRGF